MNVKYYDSESYKFDDSKTDIWITEDGEPAEGNEYIVESAGFVPLAVKFKQFEQNGYIAKFNVDDFDSSDYNSLYQDDVLIGPDDDEFDVADKIALFKERKMQILNSKLAETNETERRRAAADEVRSCAAARSEVSQASHLKTQESAQEQVEIVNSE